jgi:hypothetical protein
MNGSLLRRYINNAIGRSAMISVRLEGGLGNQLFQYAAGRSLALRHGTELLLDTSTLQRYKRSVTPRQFELDSFLHLGRMATVHEARFLPWMHRIAAISHWVSPWRTYVEKGLSFNADFASLPDQTYLVGYWQSFRYFSHISKLLIDELKPLDVLSEASEVVAEQIDTCTSVALHVRRGDYVSLASAANFHGALSKSYYESALSYVRERVLNPKYFVFSDDPEWCRKNLPSNNTMIFVGHNAGPDAWQDLMLMSRCHHHIIANSSFSWWAAWMADQRWGVKQRIVIAPKHWFRGKMLDKDMESRFPSHWVTI